MCKLKATRAILLAWSMLLIIYINSYFYLLSEDDSTDSRKTDKPYKHSIALPTSTYHISTFPERIKINDSYERGFSVTNSKLCPEEGSNILVFIAVFSSPHNEDGRNVIRNTWGCCSKRKDIALGFLIGAFHNRTVERVLKREQHFFQDIIQTKCIDSYDNLTYKTLAMLEWVSRFCMKSKFVLKTDDDMFINVGKLLDLIKTIPSEANAMYGKVIDGMPRFKYESSKHYLPSTQYDQDILPTYLSGPAYLIPTHLSQLLLNKSLDHTSFKLEDVFISGIIATSLRIKLVHNPGFYNFHLNINPCNVQHRISLHNMNRDEQLEIWKNLHNPFITCGFSKLY
ncbi:beta-1,3-galactosyltransferase 1-like [Coccinella septempunctata]|uniref:beta-1,3-galactosyltransferase 1-like n=1 Tax=Coccinella septempunctata TaxID=41139 RepID=UPI001D0677DB|nr:beta-1,3-galactosyltransferase 1-like [Coccinella septempunctata]